MMGIYKEDTEKLMARDIADYRTMQQEVGDKLGEALDGGYPDCTIYSALHSALSYGFKMKNGQWHPAPKHNSSQIITEGRPIIGKEDE